MKKIFTLLSVLLLLTSCDSKLDIVPKGKTTLSTVSDLETLLEQRFMLSSTANYETLVGNTFPVLWEQPGKTLADKSSEEYAYLAGDASVDRAELATTDYTYESAYQYINYMNVIVSKAPEASGDASDARRIVAEAKIMRAWLHFLIVNMYAAQYDEATAATTGGIAYVADTNPQTEKTKLTVAEVYDHILADCSDEVIAHCRQQSFPLRSRIRKCCPRLCPLPDEALCRRTALRSESHRAQQQSRGPHHSADQSGMDSTSHLRQ